jgi:hypothetical protein
MSLITKGSPAAPAPAATAAVDDPAGHATAGHPQTVRTTRMAALSAVVFAALFTAALVLIDKIPGLSAPDSAYQAFYTAGSSGVVVTVGLYLVPFAGIAFLWFTMAFRALLDNPSRLTGGLHLASAVAFLSLLFAGTATAGAVALMLHLTSVPAPPVSVGRALTGVGYGLVFVYGVRMAGMFVITTTTLARRAGLMPRWLAVLSYVMAAFLLVTTTTQPATLLVLPAWALLMGVVLFLSTRRPPSPR